MRSMQRKGNNEDDQEIRINNVSLVPIHKLDLSDEESFLT